MLMISIERLAIINESVTEVSFFVAPHELTNERPDVTPTDQSEAEKLGWALVTNNGSV